MKKKTFTSMLVAGIILLGSSGAEADNQKRMHSVPFKTFISSQAFTDNGYPYGRSKKGRYGERSTVLNGDEAHRILKEYFHNTAVVGKVNERRFYFEAEIRNKQGNLIDRVILDRRSGRIRSVY